MIHVMEECEEDGVKETKVVETYNGWVLKKRWAIGQAEAVNG